MTEPSLKLPRGADELLRDFPLAEPDFEAQAQAIVARLADAKSASASSDLDCFKAPELAAEPGEPEGAAPTRAQLPKGNFAEMARKSVQKKDDEAAQLAKELLAVSAQTRRPNAELVERVRAAGRNAATATPLPGSEPERPSGVVTRPAVVIAAAAEAVKPAPAPLGAAKPRVQSGTLIGIGGVVVALAACFALYVKTNEAAAPLAAPAFERGSDSKPVTAAAPAAAAAAKAPNNDGVVNPEALAAAEAPTEAKAAAKGGAVALAAKPAATPSVGAKPSGPEAVTLEDDPAPAPVAVAEKSEPEKKAELAPAEPPMKPAEGNSGSVPLNPSSGAVGTALGAVRASAQACLAGLSASVSATVTFASDGHVLRVSAGGPAGSCIQAALSKAHIAPFAKESFSAPTTIRPP